MSSFHESFHESASDLVHRGNAELYAGQAWCPRQRCPRQDSNLRSRLRRPVDVVIAGAFWRPTWAFCSRPVSPVPSGVLWFDPREIPRRVSSVDEFEAFVFGEIGVVLDVAQRG